MKKSIIAVMLVLLSPLLFSCDNGSTNPNIDFCEESNTEGVYICEKVLVGYFDTNISLKLYYKENDEYNVSEIYEYFENTVYNYDRYLDKYTEYDDITNVYTINNNNTEVHEIDDILFDAIDYILVNGNRVYADEVSLFNIALHPVLDVWHNARNSSTCEDLELGISYCEIPNEQIDGVTFNTYQDDIKLNYQNNTIEFLKPNMGIDLGGYAKGYVADVLSAYLTSKSVTYLLNLGNSNIVSGKENPTRDDGLYYIALEKPVTEFTLSTEYYQYIKVPAYYSIVTSGVNQRFFKDIDTGDVYHHIIDPRTNYPGGEVLSVTIITESSTIADILSTSIFLLDFEDAVSFVNNYDRLEAVWYLEDGSIEYSDNFEQYIYELN